MLLSDVEFVLEWVSQVWQALLVIASTGYPLYKNVEELFYVQRSDAMYECGSP